MIGKLIPWIVFAIFGFYLVGGTMQAKLGLIDDHEIALFLGTDGKIAFNEIPKVIMSTELGLWGKYQRFRPSYYTLRVVEAAVWRDNAMLWYGARYVMLILFMTLTYLILANFLPQILSYATVFCLMTLPLWSDILTRLGPSEIYAAVGLTMFAYGLLKDKYWLWFVGYLIGVGSKENMLFMLPTLILWLGLKIWNKKITKNEIYLGGLAVLFTAWIIIGIGLATSKIGTDVYGTNISYRDRIVTLWKHKRFIVDTQHLYFSLISTIGMFFMLWKNKRTVPYLLTIIMIAGVIASQYLFYDNSLPTNMRYDFPGIVALRLLDIIAFAWIWSLLAKSNKVWMKGLVVLVILSGLLFQIYRVGFNKIRNQVIGVVNQTKYTDGQMNNLVNTAKQTPEKTLIIVSNHYLDYEPIVSISRFVRARGLTNPIMLYYRGEITSDDDTLAVQLETEMLDTMNNGANSKNFYQFTKFNHDQVNCYSIILGSESILSGCPKIANF